MAIQSASQYNTTRASMTVQAGPNFTTVDVALVTRPDGDEARPLSAGRHLVHKRELTVLTESKGLDHPIHQFVGEVDRLLGRAIRRIGWVKTDAALCGGTDLL